MLTYTYNGEGHLYSVTETLGEDVVTYIYNYDTIGRLISSEKKAGNVSLLRTHQSYDAYNRLIGQSWKLGSTTYSESYTYNDVDNSISTFTAGNGETIELTYDLLRRLSSVDAGLYEKDYTYREITEIDQTTQITGLEYLGLPEDLEFGYTYNNLGYIATYAAPGEQTITYTYDNLGQLLQAVGDVTYTYTYDSAGNILTANGHTYTYGDADWKDLLTAYDNQAITYDAIGNPLSYYNGTRWTFTWENGRSLATATNGTISLSYEYDLDGLRTTKTVGNAVHDYYYAGGRLLREVITTTAEDETVTTATLDFFYDASGMPYVLKYNGVEYYYITNLQGDVVSLVDPTSGVPVATYEYDPFGKVISATGTMAEVNPLRYRGYYYDTETGFYYLQSRYYDPTICRFINADSFASTGQGLLGYNMFAYCLNNPTNLADSSGTVADILKSRNLLEQKMIDGCGGVGVVPVICGTFVVGELFQRLFTTIRNAFYNLLGKSLADNVNWDAKNKNHILKGSFGKHVDGWKRFGIDPNKGDENQNWLLLLPILQEVVDKADDSWSVVLKDGATLVYYSKVFIQEGVKVIVKIWIDAQGVIQQISDAIPYIIN